MAYKPVEYISGSVGPTIQIEGIEETMAMFEDLPKTIILEGLTGALGAAADVLAAGITVWSRKTVEEHCVAPVEVGALREALEKWITLDSNYRGGLAEVGFGKLGYIANFLEYGHAMVGHRKQRKKPETGPKTPGGFVPADPRMRPAFDAGKERAIDAFTDSVHSTLETFKAKWGMPSAA
jgi:hypothetical protein